MSHLAKKTLSHVRNVILLQSHVGATFARAPTKPPCAPRLTTSQVLQPDMSRTWRM
jgi:hypothetical protein